jgi:hypothetical protein
LKTSSFGIEFEGGEEFVQQNLLKLTESFKGVSFVGHIAGAKPPQKSNPASDTSSIFFGSVLG